ncbi:MAG: prepilin-type N-terminal cleavage/methylation domain-containing protein, partial [Candidatus Deferrimicrobium sp.]|nr:prepilin-type N-terminal cleavage/methylation domain-containing protein [Candidatus Deferrimicrobium sp.]
MGTSTPGTPSNRGFTLVELAVVLFVLGLVLWVALPRLSRVGEPDRDTVFRALSAASEAAYDLSLFEKRETRLVLHPSDG